MRRPFVPLTIAFLLALPTVGCADDPTAGDPGPVVLAEAALDLSEASAGEAALMTTTIHAAALAATERGATPDDVARAAFDSATPANLCPLGGSVTATLAKTTVTFAFEDCSSHCGFSRATGRVSVRYQPVRGAIEATVEAYGFAVNGASADLESEVHYVTEGAEAWFSIDSRVTATGTRGRTVARSGVYDGTYNAATHCTRQSGSWATAYGTRAFATRLSDYRRCGAGCPDPGGTLDMADPQGLSLDLRFIPGDQASWSTSSGDHGIVVLGGCR